MFKCIWCIAFFSLFSTFSQAQRGSSCAEDLFPKYSESRLWGYTNVLGQWVVNPIYTKVSPYVESKAIVMKGALQGAIDCEGNPIIPIQYDQLTNFNFGRTWAKQKGLWALINEKRQILLPAQFSEIDPIQNTQLTWVNKDGLWGLFNEDGGKFICKPQYTKAQIMSENATLVEVRSLYGVINHVNCKFLIQPEISKVRKVAPHIIVFKQGSKWGLFNEFGAIRLNAEFDTLYLKYNNLLAGSKSGLYGLFDLAGKEVLPVKFDSIGHFSEGYFLLRKEGKYGYGTRFGKIFIPPTYQDAGTFHGKMAVVRKDDRYGVIDIRNKFVLKPEYATISRSAAYDYFITQKPRTSDPQKYFMLSPSLQPLSSLGFDSVYVGDASKLVRVRLGNTVHFVNTATGNLAFTEGYQIALPFVDQNSIVQTNSRWGVIDSTGKAIISTQYDSIILIRWGDRKLFKAYNANQAGVIDQAGKMVLPVAYEFIEFLHPNLLKISKQGKYGLRKTNGEDVASLIYNYMSNSRNDAALPAFPAVVQKNKHSGLLNEKGIEIVPTSYDSIVYLKEGVYGLCRNKKINLADKSGRISKLQIDEVKRFSQGLAAYRKGKKWGFAGINLEEAIPAIYDEGYFFYGKAAVVRRGGKYQVIDRKGKAVSPQEYDQLKIEGDNYQLAKGSVWYVLEASGKVVLKN